MKKNMVLVLITAMLTCMLVGCGSNGTSADASGASKDVSAEDTVTDSAVVENMDGDADTSEAVEEVKNQFSMKPYGVEGASAVVSYDDEKLWINGYGSSSVTFEIKESGEEFTLRCVEQTARELYDEEVTTYLGNTNHDWSTTELKDVTVGDVTAKRFDIVRNVEGQWADRLEYFVVELGNGISLYGMEGYVNLELYGEEPRDELSLEEWIAMVMVDVAEGDGSSIAPYKCYEVEEQEGSITVSLKDGGSYDFDYDEEKLWVECQSYGAFNITYDLEGSFQMLVCDISDRYSTFEAYAEAMVADYADSYESEEIAINGKNIMIGVLHYDGTDTIAGYIMYMELENGVALYGINQYSGTENNLLKRCLESFFG